MNTYLIQLMGNYVANIDMNFSDYELIIQNILISSQISTSVIYLSVRNNGYNLLNTISSDEC